MTMMDVIRDRSRQPMTGLEKNPRARQAQGGQRRRLDLRSEGANP
jgi:hypothetical protein